MSDRFAKLFEQAQHGVGADWVSADELLLFCDFIVERGYGVQLMEAVPTESSAQRRNHSFEILGLDGEEAWQNHRDPLRSVALVRAKIESAREMGGEFVYKVWVQEP